MDKSRLARTFEYLYPFRNYCLLVAALCLLTIFYTFIAIIPQQQNEFLIPAILGLLWSLILYLSVCVFQPSSLSKNKLSMLQQLKLKVFNFFKALLSLVLLGLTLAVVIFSFRLFNALS